MKRTKLAAFAAVCAIAACVTLLQFSVVHGATSNWTPVHLPYPGPGSRLGIPLKLRPVVVFNCRSLRPLLQVSREPTAGAP